MRERGAIKLLQPGSDNVRAYRTYNAKDGRIRDFQGWLIPPSGKPVPYAKTRILDIALSQSYVYDEARAKVLECGSAAPGSIFAWEITEEEKTVFTQYPYRFQGRLPVLTSRFSMTLPAGWELVSTTFNHQTLEPQVSANRYTWELRDLSAIEREDYSPSLSALVPGLAVSYYPPAANSAGLQGLKDWTAVSTWLTPLVDPAAEVSEAVRSKAAQLTANAAGELEKIQAIAAYTQKTNYVEVALNLTRGGGYTPHRAEEVLQRNYGDCKDKATLMRALLKAAGIESYLVTLDAEDRTYVRPEWPSPIQFNHAIVAVRVSDSLSLPTVAGDSALGRLLIFDPTDPITPVGDLPEDEQGGYALVIAGRSGRLLKLPDVPVTANRIESSVEGAVDVDGTLSATVHRKYFGQSGMSIRQLERLQGAGEVKKRLERGVSRRVPGATLGRVATKAQTDQNLLDLDMDVAAGRFGQMMQGRLLVVRLGLLNSGGDYAFPSKQRNAPVKLEADLHRDSISIKVPAGFKPDELPAPNKIESPYGTLDVKWTVRDGQVAMDETLEIRETLVPVAEYSKLRDFFEQVAGAHSAPVVLVKQ
jgi:hypothetical protein